MFKFVLVPVVILAVIFCCTVPLPVVASIVASGLLWWLFVAYKDTLGDMSGVELGRSGLLDGYSTLGLGGETHVAVNGKTAVDGRSSGRLSNSKGSEPLSSSKASGQLASPGMYGQYSGGGFSGQFSGLGSSPRGAVESPRNSSRSGLFDDQLSPVSSPSVSILSRSSYKENLSYRSDDRSLGSPMLPPGSYPWLMPSAGPGFKKRINLESVPVKIKVSKPSSSFLSTPDITEEQPKNVDSSKQIIQALKAMSRKRLHTTESDDSHEDSFTALPKRRPMDFHHNLYASHLGSSDSSFQGIPEIQEENAPGVENKMADGSEPNANPSPNAIPPPVSNNGAINAVPASNKRQRAANDSGSQTAKKRNQTNNEILSSLSSSLALLDPHLIRRRLEKRQEPPITKTPAKRTKTLETHCVEVQTLPSPILKEDQTKNKEDKGTVTDRVAEGSKSSTCSTQTSGVAEKKVTSKMAAALLKSALMKLANSGELVTPDASANSNSVLGDGSSSDVEKGQKSVRFTLPETPKPAEGGVVNVNSIPNLTSAVVEQTSTSVPAFSFGSAPVAQESVPSSTGLVTASVTPITATTLSSAVSAAPAKTDKPGFTLGSANLMSITPSPTETTSMFSYEISTAPPTSAVNTAPKSTGGSAPVTSSGFKFGASAVSEQPKPSFTFGSPAAPSAPSVPSPKEIVSTSVPSATSAEIKASPFSFGQSTTAPSQALPSGGSGGFKLGGSVMQPAVTSPSSGQSAPQKPGGFAFTPSAKFTFGSSTAAVTSSVAAPTSTPATTSISTAATAPSAQPAFSFGSSSFGSKPAESGLKGLFGMPPPPSKTPSSTAEPPKLFGASGGFSFSAPSKDQHPVFAATTPQKPEEKKQEGFVFGGGGLGAKPEPAKGFNFGGAAGTGDQPKSTALAFSFGSNTTQPAFGASAGTPPAFGSFSSKPADPPGGSVFNPPATTSSTLFGSNTPTVAASGRNSVVSFGSTASKTPTFGAAATTAPTFGGSTMTATTTANPALPFGSGLTSMSSAAPTFGSATPAFGSSMNNFGSSGMTFGSGAASFGSTNPPTFGSIGGASAPATTNSPAPNFGSGAAAAPQFGSSTFGSSAPAFGSTFGAAPAFGVQQPAGQPSAPSFGAPQTTTQPSPPAFGAPQTTAQPSFGAVQTTTQPSAPAFGAQPSSQSSPFSFSASSQPGPPASAGFNYQAPQAPGAPKPMFQFGTAGAQPAQPSAPQPFAFSGAPATAPGGGFINTMFSIGSGTAAPRSRTTLRTRKK